MVDISQVIPVAESFDIQTELAFGTTVLRNDAAAEQRIIGWQGALRTFNLSNKLAIKTAIEDFVDFQAATKGARYSFLYRDRSDYTVIAEGTTLQEGVHTIGGLFPPANGSRTQFQLVKEYSFGENFHYRPITQPEVGTITIKLNGTTVTNWTLGTNGKITFTSPPSGDLRAAFHFFVPVRFNDDFINFRLISHATPTRLRYECPAIALKEIREIPYYYPTDIINEDTDQLFSLDFYFSTIDAPTYGTEINSLSSGFERRDARQNLDTWISRLGQKNIVKEAGIQYLLCAWLGTKGQGCLFNYEDKQYTASTYSGRFNNGTLTYLRQSTKDYYQVSGLEIRQFKSGISSDAGYGGLSGNILKLARICLIERPDGIKHGFTTHDRSFIIDGVLYKANTAIDPTALETNADLSVNNLEIKSIISDDDITEVDLVSGTFSDATITIAVVDYTSLPSDIDGATLEQKGIVGEIKLTDSYYVMENLTRPASLLRQNASMKVSPTCRYRFGDSQCKKSLSGLTHNVHVTEIISQKKFKVSGSIPSGQLAFGEVVFTSGANDGLTFDVLSHNSGVIELFINAPKTISVGDDLTAKAGCDKTPTDCIGYSNFINFGGEPAMADSNFMPGNDFLISPKVISSG